MFLPETETSGDYFNHQKQVKQMMCAPDQIRAVQSSRNRTHQHPICFELSSWKPLFLLQTNSFSFVLGFGGAAG